MKGDKLITEEENHHLDHKAGDVEEEAIHQTIRDQGLQARNLKIKTKMNKFKKEIIQKENKYSSVINYKK